ncbi:tetratricopeptide repeat protein [Omnitrophica bacterium]|nr:tetratricopeptide repeat protein [Candidatus Omnitrophota bacterium]
MNQGRKKGIAFLPIALIIILGFAIYFNTLSGKFIWDDHHLIKDNLYIKSWSYLPHLFTRHIGHGGFTKYNSYRPIQMVTYMVNHSLSGLDVRWYHFTNILLHVLVALAIYWLVNILYDDRLLSLITSLLFVSHPIHVAAVAYISGRADSLALFFMILSFIFYIKTLDTKRKGAYILMLLSFMLALLSRENVLIFPALLLLYHYAARKRFNIYRFMPLLSIAFAYMLLRGTFLKSTLPHLSAHTGFLQRLPGFFVAITNYIRLIFFPLDQHMEYGNRFFNITDPRAISGVVILFLLLTYAFRKRDSNRLVFFSVCWFFIALLPLSNLYPIPIAYMAEHWLYVPSIGFCLILAKGLSRLYGTKTLKTLAIAFVTLIVGFYSFLTIRYNEYWREPMVFYTRNLEYVPDSVRTLSYIAVEYYNMGKKEEAIASLKKAIRLNPDDAKAYNNLGRIYGDLGRYGEAISSYKKAIELDPDLIVVYSNLGVAYVATGETKKARASFEEAINLDPGFAGGYYNLAILYYKEKRYDLAIKYCNEAIKRGYKVDPDFLNSLKSYDKDE